MGTVRNVITTGTHCPILAGSMSVPIFFHMISSVASGQVTRVPRDQQAGAPISQVPEAGAVPGPGRLVHLALEVVVAELGGALQLDLHGEVLKRI